MNTQAWLRRLTTQLPGWHVWLTSGGGREKRGWYAVPADNDADHTAALALPGRIHAATPGELRALALERYGWHDYCGSCGVLARECGHRQPERDHTMP